MLQLAVLSGALNALLSCHVINAQFTTSLDYSEFRNQDQTYTTYNQILGGWGMYNVTGIDRTSNTLLCGGEACCANVERSGITARGVMCYAVLSCAWSKIHLNALNNSFFECWAWQGVAFSTIYGGNTYDLHAPFCGENSIIDSSGSYLDTITVNLDAYYAGYNLTIICRNNNTCNINCNGNSCHNTFVICKNNANCMVSCNESISVICPTIVNDVNEIDYGSIDYLENMPRLYDAVSKIFLLESECNNNNQSMLLDIYQADTSDNIIQSKNGHLCIRAYYGGFPSVLVLNNTEGGYSITCHGYGDCYAIYDRFEVYNGNIVCSGYGTCEDANVYMLNWNQYNETNTSSLNGNIFMGGGESGYGPWNVYDANTVICGGSGWACDYPKFYGIKNLYLLAGESNSLDDVWIYSNGRDINVHLMANNPDADTFEIYCNDGDICNIICYTHGACQSPTTVYCNGTCNIECNETIGIECPFIISNNPTMAPTVLPTSPTLYPSNLPSVAPTELPSMLPTRAPTDMPSNFPTEAVKTTLSSSGVNYGTTSHNNNTINNTNNNNNTNNSVSNNKNINSNNNSDSSVILAIIVIILLMIVCILVVCVSIACKKSFQEKNKEINKRNTMLTDINNDENKFNNMEMINTKGRNESIASMSNLSSSDNNVVFNMVTADIACGEQDKTSIIANDKDIENLLNSGQTQGLNCVNNDNNNNNRGELEGLEILGGENNITVEGENNNDIIVDNNNNNNKKNNNKDNKDNNDTNDGYDETRLN